MNRMNTLSVAALVAGVATLLAGCGSDDGPGYLKDPNSAPPISADALSEAQAEQDAVADAERAEGARYAPSRGKSRR
jgi:hypothetical protein